MADFTIKTNHVPRFTIDACELSEDEQKEFDYLDWDAIKAGNDSREFMRYKGELYDLGEFMRCPNTAWFKDWDGYFSDSAFSGIVIKWADKEFESVIVGTYYS